MRKEIPQDSMMHVNKKNLVSHTLGKVSRRLRDDWLEKWGFQPVLLETFVDPQFYHGTFH